MKKAFSILAILIAILSNSCIALSEASTQKIPPVTENSYSFQKDYDAIEVATNSIFYVDIFDANMEYVGSASGFVAFQEHLFVTNYHVVENAYFIKIWDEMDNSYILDRIVAVDKSIDLAILAFPDGEKYESLEYQLDAELKRGQPVTTIGSPQGIQNTVAFGNISAFPIVEGNKVIQFTAPISHGSSGGVLFDDNGKVIGITTAVLSEGENIGFAVPVDNLIELYKQWDKKSYKTFSIPTQKPTNAPTPKPTKYPIPSPTPKSSTNDESDSWEGVWRTLMERNNGVSAYFTLEAEWKLQLNNTLRIRFEIANNPYGKPIEAFELYAYAEDVWGNRINGDEIYYWTTIKDLLPGEKIYSDYITIVNGIEIYQVVCGINKIKYSDGTIQRPAEKSGIAWAIK